MTTRSYPILFLILAATVCSTGCMRESKAPENLRLPRLMVEPRGTSYGQMRGQTLKLPVSGIQIPVEGEPVVNEFEIVNAEMVKVDLGMALLLQLSERGARALYRASVTHIGNRIVLTINDNAIAARRLDGAISDGDFYTFVELDDEALEELVLDLKDSIAYLQTQPSF